MKILYLNFKMRYINKTRYNFEKIIQKLGGFFYGPGHISQQTLNKGIDHYVRNHGPFDLILTDEYVTQEFQNNKNITFNNHACFFNPKELKRAKEMHDFLKKYKGLRLMVLCQSDYFYFTNNQIKKLEYLADFFIGYGEEFIISKKKIKRPKYIKGGLNEKIFKSWNNNYYNFLRKNKKKIISFPELVSQEDISKKSFNEKKNRWICIGANYDSRIIARKQIDTKYKRAGLWLPHIFSVAAKLNFNIYNKFWSLSFVNFLWNKVIESSKYCYTCGSITRYPITKFFEIPIKRTLIISDIVTGLDSLGFEDGKNIIISPPEEILKVDKWLKNNEKQAERMADRGQNLIFHKHTFEERYKYIKKAFNLILSSKFKGSFWQKGEYYFS